MPPSVPLRHRLPNAPPVFVGREAQVAWLVDAIKRAPVVLVHGPGGLGKTALVEHTLHRRFPRRIPKVVFVPVEPRTDALGLLQRLLGLLLEANGRDETYLWDVSPDRERPNREALTEAVIDAAEEGGWWVVLDDLHLGDPDELAWLLVRLGRYARKARWIGTSRRDFRIVSTGVLSSSLPPMTRQELEMLGRRWGTPPPVPSDDLLARAVHVSAGSPWLLQQCLATGRAEPAFTREDLLKGLKPSAGELLEALALFTVPLPDDVLARIVSLPEPAVSDELERRGLLERTPLGWRAHALVRGVMWPTGSEGPAGTWRQGAGPILAAASDPLLAIEGLRLLLEEGFVDQVLEMLDARGERFLHGGQAPRLWRLLEPTVDDRLAGWRVRCATALGNPTSLHKVQAPPDASAEERVAWARSLLMQGQIGEARAIADEVRTTAEERKTRFEAALLVARSLALWGDVRGAATTLEELAPPDEESAARRDASLAIVLAGTERADEASRLVDDLRRRLDTLPSEARADVAFGVAYGYLTAGRLTDASGLLRLVQTMPTGASLNHFTARKALWLRVQIQLARGDLAGASENLRQLEPYLRGPSLLRPYVRSTEIALRLAEGRLEGLDETLADVHREAMLFAAGDVLVQVRGHRIHWATLRGQEVQDLEPPTALTPDAELTFLRQQEHLLRHRRRPSAIAVERIHDLARNGARGLPALATSLVAGLALLERDGATALSEASMAVRRAASSGQRLREAEARHAQCEILLELGRTAELTGASRALRSLADAMPSARFAFDAELLEMCAEAEPDLAHLEEVASKELVAPVAARRAQLLLGGDPPRDAVDECLIRRLRLRKGWRVPQLVSEPPPSPGPWCAGWGLDEAHRRVWLPGGRWVDFSRRPVHWRLLDHMAALGGVASKEDLVRGVWEEEEYHPLRHDSRLQMAVRKVRELIEDDASEPRRVITTEDGYALADCARRLRVA